MNYSQSNHTFNYNHIPPSSTANATKNYPYSFNETNFIPSSSTIPSSYGNQDEFNMGMGMNMGMNMGIGMGIGMNMNMNMNMNNFNSPHLATAPNASSATLPSSSPSYPSPSSLLFSNFNEDFFDNTDLLSNLWQRIEIIYQRELICHAIQLQLAKNNKQIKLTRVSSLNSNPTMDSSLSSSSSSAVEIPGTGISSSISSTSSIPNKIEESPSISSSHPSSSSSSSIPPSVLNNNSNIFFNNFDNNILEDELFLNNYSKNMKNLEELITKELIQLKKLHNEIEEKILNLIVQKLNLTDFSALDCEPKPVLSFETIKTR